MLDVPADQSLPQMAKQCAQKLQSTNPPPPAHSSAVVTAIAEQPKCCRNSGARLAATPVKFCGSCGTTVPTSTLPTRAAAEKV